MGLHLRHGHPNISARCPSSPQPWSYLVKSNRLPHDSRGSPHPQPPMHSASLNKRINVCATRQVARRDCILEYFSLFRQTFQGRCSQVETTKRPSSLLLSIVEQHGRESGTQRGYHRGWYGIWLRAWWWILLFTITIEHGHSISNPSFFRSRNT